MTRQWEVAYALTRSLSLLIVLGALASCTSADIQRGELASIRALVEGVYTLEESHAGGKVFTPPQVEGRVVYLNGSTIFIFHNRTQSPNQTSIASWGDYTLSAKEFSFRYTEPFSATITPTGVAHQRRLPFEGYRSYAVEREGENVWLKRQSPVQQFHFTPTALVFTEGDPASPSARRVYRRVVQP